VRDEHGLISVGTPQQRGLLALLLLNANQVVSRDRLIDELWAQKPPETAVKLVQVYVSRLRKALHPDRAAAAGDVLVTQAPGYMMRIDPEQLDVHRVERLVEEGRAALSAEEFADAAQRFGAALALWRGPPLAEFAFEQFAEAEIGRLEELQLATLEDRTDAELALGRTGLVGELEKLVVRHPLRERLRGQLMLALYRSGRQSEALDAYREARRTLVEEVGVEPGPALQRLERAILTQDPSLDAQKAPPPRAEGIAATARRRAPGERDAAVAPTPDVIVGRRHELSVLASALDEALDGRGRVFLIAGEAGIGKSRLLDELAQNARERGARVLWGRCWEAGGAPAYWPWVQSLRTYIWERDRDRLQNELGAHGAVLATILPELRDLFPDLPNAPTLESEAARFQLFEALGSFLVEAARATPLVLVLDDLHAADEPSLLLLQFVAGQVPSAPFLVAGAYRDVDLEPDTPLASVVAELARERTTHHLALAGLSEPEVARLIESSAGVRPPDRSVSAIHRGTEGNPLFVGEVVRLLSAEGRLGEVSSDLTALPLPPGVREVIGRRLRQLSDDCRNILALASVLGREFEFGALMTVSGRTEEELLDALEEALGARVIAEVPRAPDRLRFAHALIRDTLYGELGGPRRLRLHRVVGEALETEYVDDLDRRLAELAHHFQAAGDAVKTVEYARGAGDRAIQLLAYEEAERLYGVALEALGPDGDANARVRCELLISLADAQARAGEGLEAKGTFLRAAALARSADLPDLLAQAASAYGGRFLWPRAVTDERLVPLLEDGLRAIGEEDSVLRVQLLSRLAAAVRSDPARERRERLAEDAVQTARRIGDPAALAHALDATEAALHGPHNVDRRLSEADEIISLAIEIGDNERLFDGHEHAFWAAWELGDPDRRATAVAGMARVADELRQPAQLWMVAVAQTALALADGQFTHAEELIEQTARLGEGALSWSPAASRKLQLFVLRREQGRLAGFEDEVRNSPEAFPSPLEHRCVLAYVLASLGRLDDATLALHDFAGHDLSDWHVDEEWLFSMCLLADVCVRIEDSELGRRVYDALFPHASLNAVAVAEVGLGSASRALGVLAGMLGRFEDAVAHFDEALRMNARMGARPALAHTDHAYARLLAASAGPEDQARAQELAGRALEGYRDLGMDTFAAEAEELERSLSPAARP
jgi:DNA-binding SARP family transcriptional activator